ncbi:hypothetical protein CEP54_013086 [Fusarium duplospermum]|uniref:Uncharacterized protein n=1 Tax=Fusarium duplospermum TaxID=1325734 RepID=A0A428P4U9_9HYPO|nr:hypothetical protein CEP54_013086 [Fusarium duplospermum]
MHLGDIRARRRPQVTTPPLRSTGVPANVGEWLGPCCSAIPAAWRLERWCRGPDIGRGGSTVATRGEQPNGVDLDVVFQLR